MKTARTEISPRPPGRDSLTEAWRCGKITTREFHSQWVALTVRHPHRKPQPSTPHSS